MPDADICFYFDPVCPFAWLTSKWVRMVQAQRAYAVDWRFISLRMINAAVDYDSHFPAGYEAGHTAGLRLLRVAARTRAEHGRGAVGPLYAAMGARIFDTAADSGRADGDQRGTRAFVEPILSQAGLPAELAERAGGRLLRCRDPGRDRRGAGADRQGRRDADHPVPAPVRRRVLRPGDQPPAHRGRGGPAVGPRAGPGQLPGLRRAQAQPARTAAATQLRRRPRPGRHPGGLVRRKPARSAVAAPAPRLRQHRASQLERDLQVSSPRCRVRTSRQPP